MRTLTILLALLLTLSCKRNLQVTDTREVSREYSYSRDSVFHSHIDTTQKLVGDAVSLDILKLVANDSAPTYIGGTSTIGLYVIKDSTGKVVVRPKALVRYKEIIRTRDIIDTFYSVDTVRVVKTVKPTGVAYRVADVVSEIPWWWYLIAFVVMAALVILRKK